MCGLAGIAGDLQHKDLDVLKELLLVSQVRGEDATGIAAYNARIDEVDIYKQAVESSIFLQNRRADRLISAQMDVIMGHTRKATGHYTSKFNHDDAHPFWINDTVGAHNGMIPVEAINKLPHTIKGAIDSENLIYNISKIGIEETLKTAWGAWALSLIDVKYKKLSFVRNNARPLSYAFSKDKRKLYWASEAPMLYWILQRWGVETFTEFPQTLEANTLLEFDIGNKKPIGDSWTFSKILEGKEPEKKKPATVPSNGGTVLPTFGTPSKKGPLSPEDALLASLMGMENQLLMYDYSKRYMWGLKKTKKHAALVKGIDRMYKTWENWGVDTSPIPEPLDEAAAPVSFSDLVKQRLLDNGCAFCCASDVADDHLEFCTIGNQGEVLCDKCGEDESLRRLVSAPDNSKKPLLLENKGNC
jgi:hypothetical protein